MSASELNNLRNERFAEMFPDLAEIEKYETRELDVIATLWRPAPHRTEISIPPPTSICPFAGFAPTHPHSRIDRICRRRARRPVPGWCARVAIVRKLSAAQGHPPALHLQAKWQEQS